MYNNTTIVINTVNHSKTVEEVIVPGLVYTVIFSILRLVILSMGVFGNGLLIISYIVCGKLRTSTNAFILMVAISDLMLALLLIAEKLITFFGWHHLLDQRTHIPTIFILITFITYAVSVFGQVAISANRYVKICRPKYYDSLYTNRMIVLYTVILFSSAILIQTCITFVGKCRMYFDGFMIRLATRNQDHCLYAFMGELSSPTIIIFVMYFEIFRTIYKSGRRTKRSSSAKKQLRVTIGLCAAFVTLVVAFTPWSVVAILDSFLQTNATFQAIRLACEWTMLTTISNPIIYGLMNTNFKRGYLIVIRKCIPGCGRTFLNFERNRNHSSANTNTTSSSV
ncbi:melatonin receptor type 1A-A-like [Tubulanus polymorphus]|uniref:melatonin receptor type 1A-A-like n=1 Tax=Tubulanus polymorphus TaxID=672921 RepID=UPI003DA40158